jgi:pimeloyl-ACP methyl ester carboxylesterase
MNTGRQLEALAALGGAELRGATLGVGRVHAAIAARAFEASGLGARGAQAVHDAIAGTIYRTVGEALGLGGRALAPALRGRALGPRGEARVGALVAVVDGLIGDTLEREASPLAEPMRVCVEGRPVDLDAPALAAAFPQASGRLCVFVHGLMETERAWRRGGDSYGARLERELGITPVDVRFNTGRRISANGRALDELLERLLAAWPAPVEQVALVGHSMGGLVARSACHQAHGRGTSWVDAVRHVVSLGSPHAGAPLEQGVHLASAALHALPETRPLGGLLRRRSGGIRDLRAGSLVDEDWAGRDPDALLGAAAAEVPLLQGATHCFVAASLTRDPSHPLGRLIGDALVLVPSASGRGRARRIPFRPEHGMVLGGAHHFALLGHPEVYGQLRDWLRAGGESPDSEEVRPGPGGRG